MLNLRNWLLNPRRKNPGEHRRRQLRRPGEADVAKKEKAKEAEKISGRTIEQLYDQALALNGQLSHLSDEFSKKEEKLYDEAYKEELAKNPGAIGDSREADAGVMDSVHEKIDAKLTALREEYSAKMSAVKETRTSSEETKLDFATATMYANTMMGVNRYVKIGRIHEDEMGRAVNDNIISFEVTLKKVEDQRKEGWKTA
jgi:hypothetical protein